MKQAFLHNGTWHVTEVASPEIADHEVLIEVAGCGICEGDLQEFREAAGKAEPILLGHEASGVVVRRGARVSGLNQGDRVTVLGGAFAEYVASDAALVAAVPESVDLARGLGEPLACCVHAAQRFNISLGDRVAVVGTGFMGLVCLQLAAISGAAVIEAFDLLDWRLEKAAKMGASQTWNVRERSAADVVSESGEFDVVIEAAGAPEALSLGGHLLRHHGSMTIVGYHQSRNGLREVDMKMWNFKAIDVINGYVRDKHEKLAAVRAAMRLRAAGKISLDGIVSDYRLAEISDAIDALISREKGLFKANVVMS